MKKAEIIELLIKEQGYNLKAFSKECNIPYSTLYTMIKKNGISKATVDNVVTLCNCLGITIEELYDLSVESKSYSKELAFKKLDILIVKNRKKLSLEEKKELIKTLLEDD